MLLDSSTLYLVATLVAALLGGMLLYFGRHENIIALNWWGCAYLLGALAVGGWTLAGPLLGETFSLGVNAVGFIACGMVWTAARVFHGRATSWPGILAGAVIWAGAALSLPEPSSLRVIVGAAREIGWAVAGGLRGIPREEHVHRPRPRRRRGDEGTQAPSQAPPLVAHRESSRSGVAAVPAAVVAAAVAAGVVVPAPRSASSAAAWR